MSDLKNALMATVKGEVNTALSTLEVNTSSAATHKKKNDPAVEAKKAPSRRGTDQVTVFVDKRAKKQLNMLKVVEETTIQALMEEALNDLFAKYKQPEIAARK